MVARLFAAALALLSPPTAAAAPFYLGGDLSFAGQLQDCGAIYHDQAQTKDIYTIFRDHGANLVRVRIWTDGNKTAYSNLPDVVRTIRNARIHGMQVMLDFHYGDSWSDARVQTVPKAWENINDVRALADTMKDYTSYVLTTLDHQGLMPDIVQIGNEIKIEMLQHPRAEIHHDDHAAARIDWRRNATLINAGIEAVHRASKRSAVKPRILLQIAEPEAVEPWLDDATRAGVSRFDMIGISYYGHQWSRNGLPELADVIRRLRARYRGKDVMVVETAYPAASATPDMGPQLLDEQGLLSGYAATPEGQKRFLRDLVSTVQEAGGNGVLYWAPDLLPNTCTSFGGQGAVTSLFDPDGNSRPAIDFMRR